MNALDAMHYTVACKTRYRELLAQGRDPLEVMPHPDDWLKGVEIYPADAVIPDSDPTEESTVESGVMGPSVNWHVRWQVDTLYGTGPTLTIKFPWTLIEFYKRAQEEAGIPNLSFKSMVKRITCFTGSFNKAQAMSVTDYLEQTWPGKWKGVIGMAEKLISVKPGREIWRMVEGVYDARTNTKRDGYLYRATLNEDTRCKVLITGTESTTKMVSDQLRWLVTTLHIAQTERECAWPVCCTPRIVNFIHGSSGRQNSCKMVFKYNLNKKTDQENNIPWKSLPFSYLVLVGSYPIRPRPVPDSGLEVSVSFLHLMMPSRLLVYQNGMILLEGFSSCIVVTKMTSKVVVWRYIESPDPEQRLSYNDPAIAEVAARLPERAKAVLDDLRARRHIISATASAERRSGMSKLFGKLKNLFQEKAY